MHVLIFCDFDLIMPIQASFWTVFRVLTLNVKCYHGDSDTQRHQWLQNGVI